MRQRRILRIITALLCLVMLVSAFGALPVSANSAITHWSSSGSDSTGVVIKGEECPIIVESELLTFDIPELPQDYYDDIETFLAYNAKLTAQYTFYNPTDSTVTAELLFPFGVLPDYVGYNYDEETGEFEYADDRDKRNVTVNGESIEKTLRHTFKDHYGDFDLDEGLSLLHDGYAEDDFFTPDMPVTKYTYEISIDNKMYYSPSAAFDVPLSDGKTKILLVDQCDYYIQRDGDCRIGQWVEDGQTLTLYVFGQPPESMPEWRIYRDSYCRDGREVKGTVTLVTTDTMTFEEFAFMSYPEGSEIQKSDWYNAIVADLNEDEFGLEDYGVLESSNINFDLSHYLLRWYEYKITLGPGERIVNAVTAPIYPDINDDWNPSACEYTYLLSPAKTWVEFGSLEIVINTPFYMTENDIEGFEKTESGYRLTLDGLPEGELEFTLCSVEEPRKHIDVSGYIYGLLYIAIIISTVVFPAVFIVGGIIALIMFLRRKT